MENNQSTDIATREIVGKGKLRKLIIVIWHCRLAQKKAKNATTRRSKSKLSAHRLPSPDSFKVKETESFCSQPEEPLRKRKRTLNCVIPPFTHACGCLVFYVSFFLFCPLSASALLSASFVLRFVQPIYLNWKWEWTHHWKKRIIDMVTLRW